MLTSIGFVVLSPSIARKVFSYGWESTCDKESTAVFNLPGMKALVKLIYGTKSHACHNDGGIILDLRKFVTDLLSVKMITGCGHLQKKCPNSWNAK